MLKPVQHDGSMTRYCTYCFAVSCTSNLFTRLFIIVYECKHFSCCTLYVLPGDDLSKLRYKKKKTTGFSKWFL